MRFHHPGIPFIYIHMYIYMWVCICICMHMYVLFHLNVRRCTNNIKFYNYHSFYLSEPYGGTTKFSDAEAFLCSSCSLTSSVLHIFSGPTQPDVELIRISRTFLLFIAFSLLCYRVFIEYCVYSLEFFDFSELCQFCCSASFLPAWCVYTHWHRGKIEKGRNIFKKNRKNHHI